MPSSQRLVRSQLHFSQARHNADCHALLVLVIFEHLITIDREIDLFWKNKFSGSATLFLANRYLILAATALSLVLLFDTSVSAGVSQVDFRRVDMG